MSEKKDQIGILEQYATFVAGWNKMCLVAENYKACLAAGWTAELQTVEQIVCGMLSRCSLPEQG